MKRHLVQMFACLALTAAQSFAREPQAPPSPEVSGTQATHTLKPNPKEQFENIFVGHYGETLRLSDDLAVSARMQGHVEVVNFHFSTVDPLKVVSPPFNPKASDYIPENFKRLRLMQMLVIPKNVPGGYRTLSKLREAKAKELTASGTPYKLHEIGGYPWPQDSFEVLITTPYGLYQLYTQSDKNFFIITSGARPHAVNPDDPVLTSAIEGLTSSLSTYLYPFIDKRSAEKTFVADWRIIFLPWGVISVLAAMLGFLPERRNWLRRLRLIGRSAFWFTSAWHLIAGPALYAAWQRGLDRTINEASILLCAGLIMPWICRTASARLGGQRPWRVFFWSALANVLPVAVGYSVAGVYSAGTEAITGDINFRMLGLTLSTLGLLNGIAFGLAHRADGVANSARGSS